MKRLIIRPRSLLLVIALTVIAAASSVPVVHAAPTTAQVHAASDAMAASDTPCTINYQTTTCQSTNPTVTVDNYFSGDQTGCSYVSAVTWGDGKSTTNVTYSDPGDGYDLLGNHTYKTATTYTISVTLQETAGDCTATNFTAQFALLAPPPPPSPSGKACVFNAPTGGFTVTVLGQHISGHVGWAYLADPATGTWEFGANEGPVDLNPLDLGHFNDYSRTWYAQGTWADVLRVFRDNLPSSGSKKGYYHPDKYYKTYRCASVATINPGAALGVAQNQYREIYSIPDYDCLSQTVQVLATYGASISEHVYLLNPYYWVPNHFYQSGYMSKFGPQHKI